MTAHKVASEDAEFRRYYQALHKVDESKDGPYTPLDRARDFVSVFNSPAGRRVYSFIVAHCEENVPREDSSDEACRGYVARRRFSIWLANMMMPPREIVVVNRKPKRVIDDATT